MKYLALLIMLSACSSVPLKALPEAESIIITTSPPKDYKPMGDVICEYGQNYRDRLANMKACRNDLKNQAHALKADLVVIYSQNSGNGQCYNCVTMMGQAYQKP